MGCEKYVQHPVIFEFFYVAVPLCRYLTTARVPSSLALRQPSGTNFLGEGGASGRRGSGQVGELLRCAEL